MDYEELLDMGKKQLPERVLAKERFEIPKVVGHIQGNKTVISNFSQIASTLMREPSHLLKFILKELATPGELQGNLLIIGTKVSASRINDKIKEYAESYVVCPDCGKPDTKIFREGNVMFLKCQACGAKQHIKKAF
ncbi:translation initiation factor IF-2 subunit beta [Candidatus Woesearchaeota archaeon]|nr:translation initiation factor IF-2 subunit beta [Candidatus Woesearchaeota archaeon]